jgi:dTDP-4-amino-4,6-dideoxygalactose transaminase
VTSSDFIPFAKPDVGLEEAEAVVETMNSGWLTTGPRTRQFEQDFVNYLGGSVEAIAVNSATAGLHLAVEALNIGPGDEVITTTHTFTATAEVVRYVGGDPIFVDIDPETYCLDISQVESAITSRTKAIIPVHYAGLASDMRAILDLARRYKLAVIEDAAHALPTTYSGSLIGSLESDVTVFSFYANKTMTTGEGGMLVTRNPEIAKRARVMRLHGISSDAFDRFTAKKPSWYYEVIAPGFKYNLTDLASSIGICQLKKLDGFQLSRDAIAHKYHESFADLPLICPPGPKQGDMHAWHLYVIQLLPEAKINRDQLVAALFEKNIGTSVHYVPLHRQPYWRDRYKLKPENFPNSDRLYLGCLSLPIYSSMTCNEVERVISAVRYALK